MTYEKVVADGERGGLVGTEVIEVVRLARERGVDMVHDGFRDFGCLWMGRASRSVREMNVRGQVSEASAGEKSAWVQHALQRGS